MSLTRPTVAELKRDLSYLMRENAELRTERDGFEQKAIEFQVQRDCERHRANTLTGIEDIVYDNPLRSARWKLRCIRARLEGE